MTCNNTYQNHKECEIDENLYKCKQKHSKPKEILLECGEGTGSKTFTSSEVSPFQIAFVNLDTTSLNKSKILIKFSSIVSVNRLVDGATVRLKYELFKMCEDGETKSLGTWMFEEIDIDANAFEVQGESFSFIFCDSTACPECCDYFVVVMPLEIDGAAAEVSNGRIAALAQSICDSSEKKDRNSDLIHYDTKSMCKSSKAKDILLACGRGNGSIILREEDEIEPPFEIAHVTIDTTCLGNSKALIEFSSMINIDEKVTDIRLEFELFRVCGDGEAISRGSWTFERTGIIDDEELEKVFDFIFCEGEVPRGCCEYFVKVTPLQITEDNEEADIIVDNARMVALAQSLGNSDDCKPKHSTAKKIILECGDGGGRRTFRSSNEPAFELAHVTIDTTYLCSPIVNIEFSSIVSFDRFLPNSDARLRYELFRVCGNKKAISIGVWVLERVRGTIVDITGKSTNIFNFTFCDCISCPDCCEYFVTVTPIQITEGSVTATVENGKVAALAQEGCCNYGYIENSSYESSTKCKSKIAETKKLLLECGDGTGSRTFRSSNEPAFQLAHVTLGADSVNKSEVLIKFSSIVSVVNLVEFGVDVTVRLQYELFRVGDDEKPKSLGSWMFEEVNFNTSFFDREKESFSFIFCDRTACPNCCTYFVAVTPIEIENATATVENGRMAALYNLKEDNAKLKHKYSNPKNVVLACGQGNGSIAFRRDREERTDIDPPTNIAHVTLDTTYLNKPKALIEFSSIIKFDDGVDDISLQFELLRACGDGEPLSLGIWNFERIDINEFIEIDKTFDFIFCECEVPRGCCEYFVKVTPLEIDIDILGANVVLDNARMVALAQSSRDFNDFKAIDTKSDYVDYVLEHPKAKKIVLECGEGAGSRTFRSSNEPAFGSANVTIDTTFLCNPIVNIEFSSIVSFERLEGTPNARLRYELFRACDNKKPLSLGIWVSEIIDITFSDRVTNIFNFTFCDCITCPGCCDYFVTVTPIQITEGLITATVSNGRIAALAQEG